LSRLPGESVPERYNQSGFTGARDTGWPHFLESPLNFFPLFHDLESPGNEYRALKVLEFDARGPESP